MISYFQLLKTWANGNKGLFDIPIEKQLAYLDSLGEANDDLSRSFKQYRCQMLFLPKWKRCVQSLFSFVLLPFLFIYLWLKGLFIKSLKKVDIIIDNDLSRMTEVIPEEISESIDNQELVFWDNKLGITKDDFGLIIKIWIKYFFHPFFVLKILLKIAVYRAVILRYHPCEIVVHGEFSFASSLLTYYCNNNNIRHINVMHGEKLFHIMDSFFRFDSCYVWDNHYKDIFVRMKADPTQFLVAIPPSLKIDVTKYENKIYYADVKYYLANNTESEIDSIVKSLRKLKENGLSIKLRLHPRYSSKTMLLHYCNEDELEDPAIVSIQESISNLKYAAGSYSTVLLQVFFSGGLIILDDVTFSKRYEILKEMGYVLCNKPHLRLSEVQRGIRINS